VAARRIAGQEHPVLVEIELLGVGRQIIQRGCAVGQFIGDVRDSVVDSVLQQHHIVAFPKEHGSEATVVLTLPDIIILSIGRVTLKEQPVTPNRMETDISVKQRRLMGLEMIVSRLTMFTKLAKDLESHQCLILVECFLNLLSAI
jgi:hypothetical protein